MKFLTDEWHSHWPKLHFLFMGYFEHSLQQWYKKLMLEIYKCYIDDGIGVTSMSYNKLTEFIHSVRTYILQ